jgi:hypothetical protein
LVLFKLITPKYQEVQAHYQLIEIWLVEARVLKMQEWEEGVFLKTELANPMTLME